MGPSLLLHKGSFLYLGPFQRSFLRTLRSLPSSDFSKGQRPFPITCNGQGPSKGVGWGGYGVRVG